jgi:2-phospho-L-lactate guanylyltransferase (CobY/MobA/RfbA family)
MNDYTIAGDVGASAVSSASEITIHVGRDTYPVSAGQLTDLGFRQELNELLASTSEPVVVTVADLPALADDARSRLLHLLKDLGVNQANPPLVGVARN